MSGDSHVEEVIENPDEMAAEVGGADGSVESESIELERGDVSIILGSRSELKEKIMRCSGVYRISADKEKPILYISGNPEALKKAKKYIRFIQQQRVGHVKYNPATDDDGDVTIIHIPHLAIGFVAGRRSANLRHLEVTRSTLIFFVDIVDGDGNPVEKPADEPEGHDLVVFGNEFNRRCCELKILASQEQKVKGSVSDKVKLGISDDEVGTDIVEIDGHVSYAFGVKGRTKKKLENASGCIIEYIGKYAHILGRKEDRARAREYLTIVTKQCRSLDAIPDMNERPDALVIHLDCFGIGMDEFNDIEEHTQTLCYLLGLKEDKSRICVIFGSTPEKREEAKGYFEDLMKGRKLRFRDSRHRDRRPEAGVVFRYDDSDDSKYSHGRSRGRRHSRSRSRSRSYHSHSRSRSRSRSRSHSYDRDRGRDYDRDRSSYGADYADRQADYGSSYGGSQHSPRRSGDYDSAGAGRDSRGDLDDSGMYDSSRRRSRSHSRSMSDDRRSRSRSRSRSGRRSRSQKREYGRDSQDYRDSLRGRERSHSTDSKRYRDDDRYGYDQRDPSYYSRDVAYDSRDYRRGPYPDPAATGAPNPAVAAPQGNALPLVAPALPSQAPPAQPSVVVPPTADAGMSGYDYSRSKDMVQPPARYGAYGTGQSLNQDSSYRDSFRERDYHRYSDRRYEPSYDDRRDRYSEYDRRTSDRRYDMRYEDERRSYGSSHSRDSYSDRMDDRYGRSDYSGRRDSYARYSRSRSRSHSRSHSRSPSHGRDRIPPYGSRR